MGISERISKRIQDGMSYISLSARLMGYKVAVWVASKVSAMTDKMLSSVIVAHNKLLGEREDLGKEEEVSDQELTVTVDADDVLMVEIKENQDPEDDYEEKVNLDLIK